MDPKTRARLVRQWRAFSRAYEVSFSRDLDRSGRTLAEQATEMAEDARIQRLAAIYLSGLLAAGIAQPSAPETDLHDLWEQHPVNLTTGDSLSAR